MTPRKPLTQWQIDATPDAQVVHVMARKRYAEQGEIPGATIEVVRFDA